MIARYLPAALLGAHMNARRGECQHFVKDKSERANCRTRDSRGPLRCDLRASASRAAFCCLGHSANDRAVMRALCSFDATEHGLGCIGIRMGGQGHPGRRRRGRARGGNLATGQIGWFPEKFAA